MKLFVAILIISALLQSAFLPVNLVLLFLISRSLISPQQSNFYLAFLSGLMLSLLGSVNLGFYALAYLLIIQSIQLIDKTKLSANYLTVIPISLLSLLALALLEKLFLSQSFNLISIILQSLVSLPIYLVTKFWEERFIPVPVIKLRI